MGPLALSRFVLRFNAAALLAGCGAPGAIPLSRTVPSYDAHQLAAASSSYRVLYRFGSHSNDGANPFAGLTNLNGMLYGTTTYGGTGCSSGNYHCGTVYSISTRGKEKVLYSFVGYPNGDYPMGGLARANRTLYGTTEFGGRESGTGCGVIYSITPSGEETALHSFSCGADGAFPNSDLTNVKGTLYGTAPYGGTYDSSTCGDLGCGVAYSFRTSGGPGTSGLETVLHKFAGQPSDGKTPEGTLLDVRGTLYGTTEFGGESNDGTVFSINRAGKEKVLHTFRGGSDDGARPVAGLVDVKGTLYGTTQYGGSGSCSFSEGTGCGTVFSISASGTEKVVYGFGGGSSDGAYPEAGLINLDGTLYGTTEQGGGSELCESFRGATGCGTVFSITKSGTEHVLHSFGNTSTDGELPVAGFTDLNGMLYSTTSVGGHGGELGDGTIFALKP